MIINVMETKKIGIIICDRYKSCAGGKCFKSARNREGAFSEYKNEGIEIVAYTSCGGCPGGNIESVQEEMRKNGVQVIHFATGFLVGYPPCPYIEHFKNLIETKHGIKVVLGTHPIPQKYFLVHDKLGTWNSGFLKEAVKPTLVDELIRLSYD
ncbi:hypothetical protein SDC9_184097 [bioreactor metagenome]|uniref:CGGC domain-containing protein n=1 Tax=bioreactor metagenome TaxID=1076179 RepID=A0A645HC33_9ZZZZ